MPGRAANTSLGCAQASCDSVQLMAHRVRAWRAGIFHGVGDPGTLADYVRQATAAVAAGDMPPGIS